MKDITTIKLEKQTKQRLTHLKENERETYEQVIRKILYILNQIRKDPVSGNRFLSKIDRNIKRKNKYTEKEIEKALENLLKMKMLKTKKIKKTKMYSIR